MAAMSLPPPSGPEPIRVEPLGYHIPSGPPRPGIVIAVGTISIFVAVLGGLVSSCGTFYSFVFRTTLPMMAAAGAAATMPATAPAAGPGFTSTVTTTGGVMLTSATAMTAGQRQTVVIALNSKRGLSAKRLEMLDMLLAQVGDDVLPFSGETITQALVASNVSDSGSVASPDGTSTDYFVLGNGRIELGDDVASFSPSGRRAISRVVRQPPGVTTAGPATIPFFAPGALANANDTPFVLAIILSMFGLALAILLFIAGILALVGKRVSRRLHLFYAAIKIPATIATCYAYQMVASEITVMVTPTTTSVFNFQFAILAIFGCIYPLALLIVMNVQAVKSYYASLTLR